MEEVEATLIAAINYAPRLQLALRHSSLGEHIDFPSAPAPAPNAVPEEEDGDAATEELV